MGGLISKITGNKMILGATVGIVGGLIVAVLLVGVLGVGGSSASNDPAAAGKDPKVAAKATPKKADPKAAGAAHAFGPTFTIRDRIVNLADPGGRRYLRFTVALEFEGCHAEASAPSSSTSHLAVYDPGLDSPEYQLATGGGKDTEKDFQAQIKKYTPALEDIVTVVLSSRMYSDINSAEGKESVKKEIKDRVNRLLENEHEPEPKPSVCVITYPPHVTNVYFSEFVVQ
jgi:flagellar basal body-associated protein FliL